MLVVIVSIALQYLCFITYMHHVNMEIRRGYTLRPLVTMTNTDHTPINALRTLRLNRTRLMVPRVALVGATACPVMFIPALFLCDVSVRAVDRLDVLTERAGVCVSLGAACDLADVGFLKVEQTICKKLFFVFHDKKILNHLANNQ